MPERRKYDSECRAGAVTIVRETGKPIAEVARDLGIGAGILGNWVKKDRLARGEEPDGTRLDPGYVRRLERENAELRMERDVLKAIRGPVGQGGDAVSVASFVAAQRTEFGVPHALTCRALELSESWFYKWRDRPLTPRQVRRRALDAVVKRSFEESDRDYGSPRVREDLREWGWRVSKKMVAASMARQGLVGRPTRRRFRCLTRPDKAAPLAPDLVNREFTAGAINVKWCGDLTEVPTDEGKLYLAHVEDLASRRIPGFALSEHHDAAVAVAALQVAAAVRGGDVTGVIFHSDRGSEYSAELFETACARLGVRQSMGRVGSCFDNAASESFHSTLEFELLRKHHFATKVQARAAVAGYIDRYNRIRRHSSCEMKAPIDYEAILAARATETVTDGEAA